MHVIYERSQYTTLRYLFVTGNGHTNSRASNEQQNVRQSAATFVSSLSHLVYSYSTLSDKKETKVKRLPFEQIVLLLLFIPYHYLFCIYVVS